MVMVGRYTNYLRRCRGSFIQCILDEVLFEILQRLPAQLRFRSGLPSVSRTLEAVKEGGKIANKRLFFLIATVYWATVSLHAWAVTDELEMVMVGRYTNYLRRCRGSFIQCILDEVLFEILLRLPAQQRFRSGLPSVSRTLEAVKEGGGGGGGGMANKRLFFLIATVYWATVSLHAWAVTDELEVQALQGLYRSLNSPTQLEHWKLEGADPCRETWIGVQCSGSSIFNLKRHELGLTGTKLFDKFLWLIALSLAGLLVQAIKIEAVFVFASQIFQRVN
ncbi:hypothetical protein OROHE_018437 [Orobanche hederae]